MSRKVKRQCEFTSMLTAFSEINVPLCLHGIDQKIWIRPGDIMIGDADGVVCCPRSFVEDVLALLPQLTSGFRPSR